LIHCSPAGPAGVAGFEAAGLAPSGLGGAGLGVAAGLALLLLLLQ
jgi:hypothetical protein